MNRHLRSMTPLRIAALGIFVTLVFGAPNAFAGALDVHLKRAVAQQSPARLKKLARTGLLTTKMAGKGRTKTAMVNAFIEIKGKSVGRTVAALARMGIKINTLLPNGVATAEVPVNRLTSLARRSDVGRVEAGKRVRTFNDLSNGYASSGSVTWGMNNPRSFHGEGVIVGVIDSGLDWTHGDFIDDTTGKSRILYYWDQSDTDDDKLPTGSGWSFSYGHEYTKADFDAALAGWSHTWNKTTNAFAPVDDPTYPIKAAARDTNGHGTHVTGTAAGDGSASGMKGVASKADIIFVKFDFDGDRNSDTAIIDGVDYIFKRATQLGKPAVINMSLGSDFGPHDGSSLEERSIDALTGSGKVVVVAAGNPGSNNWSQRLAWGFAMHGQGNMDNDKITFRFPASAAGSTYVFFDIYYDGGTTTQVQVTAPSGAKYPPNFSGKNKRTWRTGSAYSGYNTSEGAILVGNGGDQLGWGSNNGDHELYVEISDYYGTKPANGTWTIDIIRLSGSNATYHAWHGVSSNIVKGFQAEPTPRSPTPLFGGKQSDNAYTIGSPASANKVIAVAAYQTRASWNYVYGTGTQCTENPAVQAYGAAPIDYYDPFALGELAYFSGRGPRRDGVLKPEIAAPGVGTASSFSHFVRHDEWANRCVNYFSGGPYNFGTNRVMPNLETTVIQGTSMACPNAAGAVAVMLQLDPTLDDVGLRSVFTTTSRHDAATDVAQSTAGTAQTDTDMNASAGQANNDWGAGKLDLTSAISYLGPCTSNADCNDGNACTTDVCNAGSCSNTAVADDTTCGAGGICCGGSCSVPTCSSNADCGDSQTCTTDVCVGGGTCAAQCQNSWPACGVSDGCCGPSCNANNDGDCSVCANKGASCTSGSDCCSGKCGGKPGNKTCK